MQKINVIGTSASGKTTFSRELAKRLSIPFVEMDTVFWEPNWKEPSDEVFFARLKEAIKGNSWVLDGNYNRTQTIKWERVTTIIWLDYSFLKTIRQSVFRSINRAITQKELWPGTGNKESFVRTFFSKDSVVLWMLKTYGKNRKRYLELSKHPMLKNVQFVHIKSPEEANEFLNRWT